MALFKPEYKDGFAHDFSDQDIDRFVAYLKEKQMVMDEAEVLAALHAQSHDDPRKIRERKLPKELIISEDSDLFRLFQRWEERPDDYFNPLEFMTEHIEFAHEVFLRNRAALRSGNVGDSRDRERSGLAARRSAAEEKGKMLELDPVQKDLKKFETELESASGKRLRFKKDIPENASVRIRLSEDKIRAWLFVFPPCYGGMPVSEEQIREALTEKEVVHGIDTYLLKRIAKEQIYFRIFPIATGLDVAHGRNGSVEELVRRERKLDLREDTHGNVNYKELNYINNVREGDPICSITLPTKARDGKSVRGEIVPGKDGKPARVPAGKHTTLSEDGKTLYAAIDGEVVYSDGRFTIQRVLTIARNIDLATGNIDFPGDVIIKGDVRDGFSVRAGGTLQILGTAEGAHLSSGGDMTIQSGMIGGQRGDITCGGTLTCKYLEHCTVYAKGSIYVDTIILSNVSSEEEIVITNKRGGISGGKITAVKQVKTTTAGAKNNPALTTAIHLGATPKLLEDLKSLHERKKAAERNAKRIELNIHYIESSRERQSEERIQLLGKLKVQYQMALLQLSQLDRLINALNEKLNAPEARCSFTCTYIYPTVTVTIGEHSISFEQEHEGCTVCDSGAELQVLVQDAQEKA